MSFEEPSPRADATSTAAALAEPLRPSRQTCSGSDVSFSTLAPWRAAGPRDRVARFRTYVGANHQDHARPVASSHECVLRPGGEWKKSQARRRRSSPSTSSLHSPVRTRNASVGLGVIDAALARLEDIDPELLELDRGFAVLVCEPARRAPRLRSEPLGIAHVDDEPALGDGGEPGASVLKPRFGQEPDSRSPSDTPLTCANVPGMSPDATGAKSVTPWLARLRCPEPVP